jgi:nuclear transport factor 2 (NTF2) superfamily protein
MRRRGMTGHPNWARFSRIASLAMPGHPRRSRRTRSPRVALGYTADSRWRNRSEFFHGRAAIVEFLTRKWANELNYRLIKELWAFDENRISVRFQYEWRDDSGHWFRAHGNEQWEFDTDGLMRRREASINDVAIAPEDRKFLWPAGPRPASHPGLTALGL